MLITAYIVLIDWLVFNTNFSIFQLYRGVHCIGV